MVQTVNTNPLPGATVGSYANAISMPDPDHVLVSVGRDNAVAVYNFKGLTEKVKGHGGWGYDNRQRPRWLGPRAPPSPASWAWSRARPPASPSPRLARSPGQGPARFEGLMPTDWYPVQVQPDPALGSGTIVVTNARGIGDRGPQEKICKGPETSPATECATGFNTYDETGTVTVFKMPSAR